MYFVQNHVTRNVLFFPTREIFYDTYLEVIRQLGQDNIMQPHPFPPEKLETMLDEIGVWHIGKDVWAYKIRLVVDSEFLQDWSVGSLARFIQQ